MEIRLSRANAELSAVYGGSVTDIPRFHPNSSQCFIFLEHRSMNRVQKKIGRLKKEKKKLSCNFSFWGRSIFLVHVDNASIT